MFRKVSKVAGVSKNLILLFVLFAIPACSQKKNESSNDAVLTLEQQKVETTNVTIYFPKIDASGIAKTQMEVADKATSMNQSFDQIILGLSRPADPTVLAIFPEKFGLYGTFLDKDILYLDFAAGIEKAVFPNIQLEHLALEAFLTTIKVNFPYVQQVKFLSEHEDAQVVFGHTYAQQPFSLKDL